MDLCPLLQVVSCSPMPLDDLFGVGAALDPQGTAAVGPRNGASSPGTAKARACHPVQATPRRGSLRSPALESSMMRALVSLRAQFAHRPRSCPPAFAHARPVCTGISKDARCAKRCLFRRTCGETVETTTAALRGSRRAHRTKQHGANDAARGCDARWARRK